MTGALLQLDHVAVRVAGRAALRDIRVEVPVGGSVGLVGETGSGKSLSCRVMLGLLPRIGATMTAGSATFDGADLQAMSDRDWAGIRGREIGFVPQSSGASLDPIMRIGAQLRETVRLLDPEVDAVQRTQDLLDMVQIADASHVARRYPHELSGGMRQRVMIALGLAGRPRVLIADECTTALDVTIQRAILVLLGELRRELHMALVLVTHDLGVVESACDTVSVMHDGFTVEQGRVVDVLTAPQHEYTQRLLAARLTLRSPLPHERMGSHALSVRLRSDSTAAPIDSPSKGRE